MPYFLPHWAQLVRDSRSATSISPGHLETGRTTSRSSRVLRTIPHDSAHKGAAVVPDLDGDRSREGSQRDQESMTIRHIQNVSNIVKSQVEELYRTHTPAHSTEDSSFYRYAISVKDVIFSGTFSTIYLAHHQDNPQYSLVGRVYEPSSKIDSQRSNYIKILKHLGKRHHSLISTWDIFFDANGRVVIFQEFALFGNLQDHIKTNNSHLAEMQMMPWAQQIYRSLDFLGEAGICHRSICPKHILLSASSEDSNKTVVKLGSFRDSIIYYDHREGQVRNQPCRSLDKRASSNFHAPEVFGNANEEYEPISADVYSYGATFFFAATRTVPCQYKASTEDISLQIQKTIDKASTLSADAKRWFSGLLQGNAALRTTFDKIEADSWFNTF